MMGTTFLFSPFPQLCLAAYFCHFEKMRERLADVAEKELRSRARHGNLQLSASPRGQGRESHSQRLDSLVDHLSM